MTTTTRPTATATGPLRRYRREHGDPRTWSPADHEQWLHLQDAAHAQRAEAQR